MIEPVNDERRLLLARSAIAAAAMVTASVGAVVATPKPMTPDQTGHTDLKNVVPEKFGNWVIDARGSVALVSPEAARSLERLYSDTLSRTYMNDRGERVMLSIAYGAVQSRELQIHKPEVCYVSQGFELIHMQKGEIGSPVGSIPTMRLVARMGPRTEPITYWIRSGDEVVRGWFEQNRARISSGLRGQIPDGLLFRVSTIGVDREQAFRLQEAFIAQFLDAIEPAKHRMFVGSRAEVRRQS
jgi:EpsI family protein